LKSRGVAVAGVEEKVVLSGFELRIKNPFTFTLRSCVALEQKTL